MADRREFTRIRVEQDRPVDVLEQRPDHEAAAVPQAARAPQSEADWRKMALGAGERLSIAENQAKDLRQAADDMRARLTKQKTRLDNANAKVNELQAQLITACAERDELKDRVGRMEIVKRKLYEYRRSLMEGPLWEMFENL